MATPLSPPTGAQSESKHALFLAVSAASGEHPAKRQFAEAWSDDGEDDETDEADSALPQDQALFPPSPLPAMTWLGQEATRQLIDVYEHNIQAIHPMLAWPEFRRQYDAREAYLPHLPDERIWLSTLQMVLAHALQDATAPQTRPETLFAEALQLLGLSYLLTTTTPDLVRCLLLMTAFTQTISQPDLSVSLLGLAIHKSRALGYATPRHRLPPDINARICWSGCTSRDFYVSMALGRTPLMSESECRTDLLPLTAAEDAAGRLPGATPHPLAYFNESIKLIHVLYPIFHRVYPYIGSADNFDIQHIQRQDSQLATWHASLPPFFADPLASPCPREATFIHLRHAYTRNLLHRPSLCHLLALRKDKMLPAGLGRDVIAISAKAAGEAAVSLIEQLRPVLEETTAWWINLISLYSACLTLIMAIRLDGRAILSMQVAPHASDAALDSALQMLDSFTMLSRDRVPAASRTADQCQSDIRRIREKLRPQPSPSLQASALVDRPAALPVISYDPLWSAQTDAEWFNATGHADDQASVPAESLADFSDLWTSFGLFPHAKTSQTQTTDLAAWFPT